MAHADPGFQAARGSDVSPTKFTSHHLSADDIARFRGEGFLAPLRVMSQTDMAVRLDWLQELEAQRAGRLPPAQNVKSHLLIPWLWDLVHDARILDPVEDLLGPDILCWGAGFFDKRPGEPHHVTWHQDATYWGLSAPEAVTAWVAFTPSTHDNGCMRVSPRSHGAQLVHIDTHDRTNMLPGRETVLVDIDEASAVDIVLAPGEMSLHHLLLVHGSRPNRSDRRRCGLAIRYIPAHLTNARGPRGTATLVRGRDHGHFDLEQAPEAAFDPAALARYTPIFRLWMRGVFAEMSRDLDRNGAPAER
jgi:non-heme Fe2+,alpha-ketoglutarate-dependent halogenase